MNIVTLTASGGKQVAVNMDLVDAMFQHDEAHYTAIHFASGMTTVQVTETLAEIGRKMSLALILGPPPEDGTWVSGTWLPHWKAGIDTIIPTPDPYTRHLMHPADRELVKRAMTSLAVHSFSDMMKEINDFLRRHDLGELQ